MHEDISISKMCNIHNDEQRPGMRYVDTMSFLAKALYMKNEPAVLACFPGKDVALQDIAYFMRDDAIDYMYVVASEGLVYLMTSDFRLASEGYDEILQLHNKTPYMPGYIVRKRVDYIYEDYNFGVLGWDGSELIECKYKHIWPVCWREITRHDPDHPGGVYERRNDLMFMVCTMGMHDMENYGKADVYAPDGTPVFRNVDRLFITEENVRYEYSHLDDYCYDEIRTLRKFDIGTELPDAVDSDGNAYPVYFNGRYVYSVCGDYPVAEIVYQGPEQAWYEASKSDADIAAPDKPLLPLVDRINLDTIGSAANPEPRLIADFLRRLVADEGIYDFVNVNEINTDWQIPLHSPKIEPLFPPRTKKRRDPETDTGAAEEPDFPEPEPEEDSLDDLFADISEEFGIDESDAAPASKAADDIDIFSQIPLDEADFIPAEENHCRISEPFRMKLEWLGCHRREHSLEHLHNVVSAVLADEE